MIKDLRTTKNKYKDKHDDAIKLIDGFEEHKKELEKSVKDLNNAKDLLNDKMN